MQNSQDTWATSFTRWRVYCIESDILVIIIIIIIIFFIQLSYICRVSFNACYTDANFAILSVQQLKRNYPETYWSVYCVVGKPVRYALPLVICHTFPDFETLVLVLILIASCHSLLVRWFIPLTPKNVSMDLDFRFEGEQFTPLPKMYM